MEWSGPCSGPARQGKLARCAEAQAIFFRRRHQPRRPPQARNAPLRLWLRRAICTATVNLKSWHLRLIDPEHL